MLIFLYAFLSLSKKKKQEDITPTPKKGVLFFETFDGKATYDNWNVSQLSNYSGIWKVRTPPPPTSDIFEKMLILTTKDKYSAISTKLPKPILIREKPFILQFEFRAINNVTHSGAYIKLFDNPDFDPKSLSNETRQFLMFGPDFNGPKKIVSFYFFHENPKTHFKVEKSLKNPPKPRRDDLNHLYTLIVRPNGTYSILIDNEYVMNGEFMDSFNPPIIPPKQIPDPNVKKPSDWDDKEFIPDDSVQPPNFEYEKEFIPDKKHLNPPPGWLESEPKYIQSTKFHKPDNWDDELLGEWKPPLEKNPKCEKGCGKYYPPLVGNPNYIENWEPPMKKNPNYSGKWIQPLIDNPNYFEDYSPWKFPTFYAIGFELMTTDGNLGFNNILIADDEDSVVSWNSKFWIERKKYQTIKKHQIEKKNLPTQRPIKSPGQKTNIFRFGWEIIVENWVYMFTYDPIPTLLITFGLLFVIILFTCIVCSRFCSGEIDDPQTKNIKENKID